MTEMFFRRFNTALLVLLVLFVVNHEWGSPWGIWMVIIAFAWSTFVTATEPRQETTEAPRKELGN